MYAISACCALGSVFLIYTAVEAFLSPSCKMLTFHLISSRISAQETDPFLLGPGLTLVIKQTLRRPGWM